MAKNNRQRGARIADKATAIIPLPAVESAVAVQAPSEPQPGLCYPSDGEREELLKCRNDLNELRIKNAEAHDKMLTALSSGALTLSLAFVHQLAPHPVDSSTKYLVGGWVAFVVSLCLLLISFFCGQKSCQTETDNIDERLKGYPLKDGNRWSTITDRIGMVASGVFMIGVVSTLWFVGWNMPSVSKAAESIDVQQKNEEVKREAKEGKSETKPEAKETKKEEAMPESKTVPLQEAISANKLAPPSPPSTPSRPGASAETAPPKK